MKRTQVYLDDDQTVLLDERAAAEGTSRAVVIRRAVDVYLERKGQDATRWHKRWKKAIDDSAGVAPYLEDGPDYVEGIRRAGSERPARLQR